MNNFNYIKSRKELANYLGIEHKKLTYILYIAKPEDLYVSFEIDKKNGGKRKINSPSKQLKRIQKKLANAIREVQDNFIKKPSIKSNISHGFEKGKGIITNAKCHINKRYVLNLDIENFFESFHFGRVRGYFEKNNNFKLPKEIATIIAQLTCYNGKLPQGAPTSPIITNLICNTLDMHLAKIAKKYRVNYTRYADDLTFSTNDKCFIEQKDQFLKKIDIEIEKFGLKINSNKTRLTYNDSRQVVTGLVVNKKISVNRDYYRKTRAMAYSLYKNREYYIDGKEGSIRKLEGRFGFINQIDYYNNKRDDSITSRKKNKLNSREKEYQKFLFYKYFCAYPKPLIVTEGKTDINYLKAAIKNLCLDYPELVEIKDNKYHYKISFLRRTKRLRYFFDFCIDGGDAMKCIYNLYEGKNGFPELGKYFDDEAKKNFQKPVFLLFDNEQKSIKENRKANKPLEKFLQHIGSKEIKDKSKKIDKNLYIITVPLLKDECEEDRDECEIEDLFSKELLNIKIGNKTFSRENSFDDKKHFGKKHFSKYVLKNYRSIDFNNFRPMLDELQNIAKEHSYQKLE